MWLVLNLCYVGASPMVSSVRLLFEELPLFEETYGIWLVPLLPLGFDSKKHRKQAGRGRVLTLSDVGSAVSPVRLLFEE